MISETVGSHSLAKLSRFVRKDRCEFILERDHYVCFGDGDRVRTGSAPAVFYGAVNKFDGFIGVAEANGNKTSKESGLSPPPAFRTEERRSDPHKSTNFREGLSPSISSSSITRFRFALFHEACNSLNS